MSLRVKAANDRQAFWLLADGFFRVSPAIIPMTTESNISAGRGLPDYQFSSGLASALFRCLPKARGASWVGALRFKVLPIDPAVIMRAVVDAVTEQRMGHKGVHALLISAQEPLSATGRQRHRRTDPHEIARTHHSGIDCPDHYRIRNQGPEPFHEVERQSRPAK